MVILQNTHEPTVSWTHTADNMHKLIKCRGGWQLSGCDGLSLHTVSLCTVKQYVEKVHAICHGCDGLSLHTVSLCTVIQCAESPSHPPPPPLVHSAKPVHLSHWISSQSTTTTADCGGEREGELLLVLHARAPLKDTAPAAHHSCTVNLC